MARSKDRLYLGVGNHVVAIDAATGAELWRTKLKLAHIVTVAVAGGRVFGGAAGEVFCLDAATGELLWRNPLKRLGMGLVAFSHSGDVAAGAAVAAAHAATAAATAGA